jgi:hypothetical protein
LLRLQLPVPVLRNERLFSFMAVAYLKAPKNRSEDLSSHLFGVSFRRLLHAM